MRNYYLLLGILLTLSSLTGRAESTALWLLIDTRAEKITVMGAEGPLDVFENIAIGVRGAGIKQRRGDEITPLGSFTISWISQQSRFHRFIGLNYPNFEHANLAYHDGRIKQATYQRIVRALRQKTKPPQDTILGGYIGIHGIGAGDPLIHENINWTNGCIALTNQQIIRLLRWVKVGMRVEIR